MDDVWVQVNTWHLAVGLHKLEVKFNDMDLTCSYSEVQVESDATVNRNPMHAAALPKGVHSSRMRCSLRGSTEYLKHPSCPCSSPNACRYGPQHSAPQQLAPSSDTCPMTIPKDSPYCEQLSKAVLSSVLNLR